MELIPPPKAEALAHLDGDGPAPPRYAQVTVIRGSHSDCMDYKVCLVTPRKLIASGNSWCLAPSQCLQVCY